MHWLVSSCYKNAVMRYYLLRKVPTTGNANLTPDEFVQTYNADLVDQLGNLVQRVVKMVEGYCGRRVPALGWEQHAPGTLLPPAQPLFPKQLS